MHLVVRSPLKNNFIATDTVAGIPWCFRPLFIWMRIMGIDLYHPTSRKSIRRYGLVMLLLGTWAHIDNNLDTFRKLLSNKLSASATLDWNIGIDYVNNFGFIVLVSHQIFYVAGNQWLLLWGHVVKFDLDYCRFHHKLLRKLLLIGFLSPLLEICNTLFIFSSILPDFAKDSTYRKCITVLAFFSKILPISALVLYCSVAWLSSLFYEEIRKDIYYTKVINEKNIRKWKCSLVLAGNVVDGINDTFGLILLISVTHFYVDLISHLFYTWNNISSLTRLGATIYLVNVLRKLVFFWFIVWTPTEIYRKAFKVATLLRKINGVQFHLQKQVHFLALDTFKNLPQISSLGYFDVNLRLIPKLIGTILTYLVILYQFQSSEKKP
ncbi:hypothetical protein DAPPUDRAFT_346859 [Daphnia pulex]|uniref:Gustatory receptor n=1 Tax=Daphnia pulex TaxID=6669 RepID=E9FXF3_DAPPU|nr:hypothetical protein DAPPUDRAFT_346859 [Daphnia pulex]|eukprot:EFX88279.1 hypothetical protein DAPPUDRAFT_346859 [Daphnia pulex]